MANMNPSSVAQMTNAVTRPTANARNAVRCRARRQNAGRASRIAGPVVGRAKAKTKKMTDTTMATIVAKGPSGAKADGVAGGGGRSGGMGAVDIQWRSADGKVRTLATSLFLRACDR